MEGIQEKILFYHQMFLVFLAAFLLCLALSAVLFFILGIPEVLGYLTGWRARKSIQRMEEESGGPARLEHQEYMAEEVWDGELTALLAERHRADAEL